MRANGALKTILRLAVSTVMLVLVFSIVDFSKFLTTLSNVPIRIAILLFIGYTLGQVMSACKWWLLAKAGNVHATFPEACRAYFIGMYVNCFGLGTVGGDVTRGVLISGTGFPKANALASVVADRIHGLAVLAFLGSLATVVFGRDSLLPDYLFLTLLLIGPLVVVGWFFGPAVLLSFIGEESLFRKKVEDIAALFPKSKALILITVISVLFHLLQISLHGLMGIGIGVNISWGTLLVIIPFVNIASTIPISWNGLGVREGAYLFFLTPAILTKEQAVTFGTLWLLSVTLASAIGGVLSVLTPKSKV